MEREEKGEGTVRREREREREKERERERKREEKREREKEREKERKREKERERERKRASMGWLRLVGSSKLQVSSAKEPYKRDYILQKRSIILKHGCKS